MKPEALEYTWLTGVLNGRTTRVEVEFHALERGSKIDLSHGDVLNESEMQLHIDGWVGCLGKLQEHLEGV